MYAQFDIWDIYLVYYPHTYNLQDKEMYYYTY